MSNSENILNRKEKRKLNAWSENVLFQLKRMSKNLLRKKNKTANTESNKNSP